MERTFFSSGLSMRSLHCMGGFTLIEAIIAMFILSMVLIVLQASLISFARTNVSSRDLSAATAAANKVLESMRALPYGSIQSSSGEIAGTSFYQTTTVTADQNNRKKTIAVTVAWPKDAPRRSVTLSTIVAR